MTVSSLTQILDGIHAYISYQILITPLRLPLIKKYRDFSRKACESLEQERSTLIRKQTPLHYVLHRFTPVINGNAKKILIAHGWMSRAAYMIRWIQVLYQQGYEIYALDFPGHGDAKNAQLTCIDAISIMREVINIHGPFYGIIGHSFGGLASLNTLSLATQLPEWQLNYYPERVVLVAAPTSMRGLIGSIARRLRLSQKAYLQLLQRFTQCTVIDPKRIELSKFIAQSYNIPFLCIHGEHDETVSLKEPRIFCSKYKNATLSILANADHVSVLMDKRVEALISEFLL